MKHSILTFLLNLSEAVHRKICFCSTLPHSNRQVCYFDTRLRYGKVRSVWLVNQLGYTGCRTPTQSWWNYTVLPVATPFLQFLKGKKHGGLLSGKSRLSISLFYGVKTNHVYLRNLRGYLAAVALSPKISGIQQLSLRPSQSGT